MLGYCQFPAGMHSPSSLRDQRVLPDKHYYFKSCRGRTRNYCTENHARQTGVSESLWKNKTFCLHGAMRQTTNGEGKAPVFLSCSPGKPPSGWWGSEPVSSQLLGTEAHLGWLWLLPYNHPFALQTSSHSQMLLPQHRSCSDLSQCRHCALLWTVITSKPSPGHCFDVLRWVQDASSLSPWGLACFRSLQMSKQGVSGDSLF